MVLRTLKASQLRLLLGPEVWDEARLSLLPDDLFRALRLAPRNFRPSCHSSGGGEHGLSHLLPHVFFSMGLYKQITKIVREFIGVGF
jgi:hypothetical protein